jgi:hypothetical protein
MKKTMFTLAIATFLLGVVLSGCQSSENKVENAQDNVQDAQKNLENANQALNQAIKDSIQQFKKESQAIIILNDQKIAEFKAKISKQKKENREKYEKTLAELERKNAAMKQKLDNYKDEEINAWQSFKREVNYDMKELGDAINDIGKNNTK